MFVIQNLNHMLTTSLTEVAPSEGWCKPLVSAVQTLDCTIIYHTVQRLHYTYKQFAPTSTWLTSVRVKDLSYTGIC